MCRVLPLGFVGLAATARAQIVIALPGARPAAAAHGAFARTAPAVAAPLVARGAAAPARAPSDVTGAWETGDGPRAGGTIAATSGVGEKKPLTDARTLAVNPATERRTLAEHLVHIASTALAPGDVSPTAEPRLRPLPTLGGGP
jgi:hypothetical protein